MSHNGPEISIPVDLQNPGQFFACCGLFEVADRLSPDAGVHACFSPRAFHLMGLHSAVTIAALIRAFAEANYEQLDRHDNAASPLRLAQPFNLRLDWWVKPELNQVDLGGGGKLKTWAGKQFAPLIFGLMKKATNEAAEQASPLDYSASIFDNREGKGERKTISPFYFDSRREGTCLDIGFSPDEQNMSVEAFPAVESLAMVGLQRFRPFFEENSRPSSFLYTCWTDPLPILIAAVATSGTVPVASCGRYKFSKPSRGGEYMTMFSRATRERNSNA
jgi:CRISPR-associated protein Csx14